MSGLRGSYIAGNGLVACRAVRWSWPGAHWCQKSGALSQRMVVVEGQWVLLGAANGVGVCGTMRATMVAQFSMGAMVWVDVGCGFVLERASGYGGCLS